MEQAFWHDRWHKGQLGFHLPFVHPILTRYLPAYDLPEVAGVFVPLCGKTLDIGWLLAQGHRVIGAELSERAVSELFVELGVEPHIEAWKGGRCFRHGDLTVFQGDIFALEPGEVGAVDLVYDRAALVAMPAPMRKSYVAQVSSLSDDAPQLLISFEYDPREMDGPPFPVLPDELERLYTGPHALAELSRKDVIAHQPAFREAGVTRFVEVAWQLLPSGGRGV
ncbi:MULTISPECIES: thiopurine S-methyltransferase [unclassified Modicisalibacter]|uniref:thiopurine S-methyltransferase n=1 Tax=unclassified Modicisalibacter TaxID=2679913 RepID=UPI001CCA17C4|nr:MULTISPECIES: thiopurine S-methyltransferase [unclassified Modicisalibacter]MBZ9557902.1 thiopurine S-methyltransferase [Modicisalibacter sp. R2A 31.J]MBZ9573431.1 thiopurine S-methyltransferase [Modicisalibacter sp. MOD 31.J]